MEEIPNEYIGLLYKAKRRRTIIGKRTERKISKMQWKLGEIHGSEGFFGETHLATTVPLSGGYVEVHARVDTPNLQRIFEEIEKSLSQREEFEWSGAPTLLQMEVHGPNGGKVHIVSSPVESGSTSTTLHIIGMGHTRDIATIFKIVGNALKSIHRQSVEERITHIAERESVR